MSDYISNLKDDVEFFKQVGILVSPINITVENNTKSAIRKECETANWENPAYNKYHTHNNVIKNIINKQKCIILIRVINESNICVIDWDVKPGNTPTEESLTLKSKCLKSDTLTIKTPRGGYHFLFRMVKNNDDFKLSNPNLFKNNEGNPNVDYIANNIIFYGRRFDGDYSIIDKSKKILDMPFDIQFLMIQHLKKKNIPTLDNILHLNDREPNVLTPSNPKCFIPKHTLRSLIYLLSDLSEKYLKQYSDWIIITSILILQDEYEIWDEWSKSIGSPYYDCKKNNKIWNKYDITSSIFDVNYIVFLINSYKYELWENANRGLDDKHKSPLPNKIPIFEKIYYDYKPLTDINLNRINEYIDIPFINKDIYYKAFINKIRSLIIEAGLGTAKTTSAISYCIENKYKILSIYHLITIGKSQSEAYDKILKDNPQSDNIPYVFYDDKVDKDVIAKSSIFCTINSLYKIGLILDDNIDEYVVYLDEIHSLLNVFYTATTLDSCRTQCYSAFLSILRSAKKIIMTDGVVNNAVINLLDDLKIDFHYIRNTHKKYTHCTVKILSKPDTLYNEMNKCIKANTPFVFPHNKKNNANRIKTYLLAKGIKSTDIVIITADEGVYENIIKKWKNKWIIFSPRIVQGIDYSPVERTPTFGWYCGIKSISPEDAVQQFIRNRNPTEMSYVLINCMHNEPYEYKTIDTYTNFMINTTNRYSFREDRILDQFITEQRSERNDGYDYSYDARYLEIKYNRHMMDQNVLTVYVNLLKKNGFKVIYEFDDIINDIKTEICEIKDVCYIEDNTIYAQLKYYLCGLQEPDIDKILYDRFVKIEKELISEFNVLKSLLDYEERIQKNGFVGEVSGTFGVPTPIKQEVNKIIKKTINTIEDTGNQEILLLKTNLDNIETAFLEYKKEYRIIRDDLNLKLQNLNDDVIKKETKQTLKINLDSYTLYSNQKKEEIKHLKDDIGIKKQNIKNEINKFKKTQVTKCNDEECMIEIHKENKLKEESIMDLEYNINDDESIIDIQYLEAYIKILVSAYCKPDEYKCIINLKQIYFNNTDTLGVLYDKRTKNTTINNIYNDTFKGWFYKHLIQKYIPEIDLATLRYDTFVHKFLKDSITMTNDDINDLKAIFPGYTFNIDTKMKLLDFCIRIFKKIFSDKLYITQHFNKCINGVAVRYKYAGINPYMIKAYKCIIDNKNNENICINRYDDTYEAIKDKYLLENPILQNDDNEEGVV